MEILEGVKKTIDCEALERKILDAINDKNSDHGKIDIMAEVDYNWFKVKVAVRDRSINYKNNFGFAMDIEADQKAFEDYVVTVVSDDYLKYAEVFKPVDLKSALHYEDLSEEEYYKKLNDLINRNLYNRSEEYRGGET